MIAWKQLWYGLKKPVGTDLMTPEIKELWLKALDSGLYKHGRHELCFNQYGTTYHCCLGVLREEMEKKFGEEYTKLTRTYKNSSKSYLTNEELNFIGMSSRQQVSLGSLNDDSPVMEKGYPPAVIEFIKSTEFSSTDDR